MGTSEEAADGANDLIDLEDAGDGELLVLKVGLVDGDEEEGVGGGAAAQDLDGADGVEDDGVDLAVLDVVDRAAAQGDDIAVADLGLHGVAGDVAPDAGLLEAWGDDAAGGGGCLVVEYLAEASDEVHVEVGCSLGGVFGERRLRLQVGHDSFGGAALQHLPSPGQ